jgi:hypothetical protein
MGIVETTSQWAVLEGMFKPEEVAMAGDQRPDSGPERAQFFIHSPFAWRQNEVVDRNGGLPPGNPLW